MLEVTSNISTYLDCFELEKFEPVDSEEQLTKRGLELLETNQLWGGLVRTNICFLNVKMFKMPSQVFVGLAPGQQELPKFVTYKIRIDADKVGFTPFRMLPMYFHPGGQHKEIRGPTEPSRTSKKTWD